MDDGLVTLARDGDGTDEIALRARTTNGHTIIELIVDGAFAMDSAETASERALAGCAAGRDRVLVGGLGLGYTVMQLLDDGATRVDVVELSAPLLRWAREGLTPELARAASDPRVRLHRADLADVLRTGSLPDGATEPFDAVLLDVDNGPDFLIHGFNAGLYEAELLAAALRLLVPGGLLAIWCQQANLDLAHRLGALASRVEGVEVPVVRGNRPITYMIYVATR